MIERGSGIHPARAALYIKLVTIRLRAYIGRRGAAGSDFSVDRHDQAIQKSISCG
jgi:hypothetical protein